jgi:hypothetical protein
MLRERWGQWTIREDPDPKAPGFEVLDADGERWDWYETRDEAASEAQRLDRRDQVESLREAVAEQLDELDGADDQATIDRLKIALATLEGD